MALMIRSWTVLIAGGGYVGLVRGRGDQRRPHRILQCDARGCGARADAISPRTSGPRPSPPLQAACWSNSACGTNLLPQVAQPITEMIVTDSRTTDPVRPVFLTFGDAARCGRAGRGPALCPYGAEYQRHDAGPAAPRRKHSGVDLLHGRHGNAILRPHDPAPAAVDARVGTASVESTPAGCRRWSPVAACASQAGIKTVQWAYDQMGIVTTVANTSVPMNGRAEEHFLPGGPFATLPLRPSKKQGNRSSLVWTEPTENAQRLMAAWTILPLSWNWSGGLATSSATSKWSAPRKAFPLGLTLARDFVKPRFALVGDAAHGIHPIAGQGLNLGFKDAAALAQVVVETDQIGPRHRRAEPRWSATSVWRRFDTVQMGVVTDVLNRLFSNDIEPLRLLRTVGLGIVDRMPFLKQHFINQAAGRAAGNPALLNGETI